MMKTQKDEDRFTLSEGDLQVTEEGDANPHGYSFSTVGGQTTYYDDEGQPVDPTQRPITAGDLAAATRGLKIDRMAQDELRNLAERYEARPEFAARVVARAARERLKKL